MKPKKAVFHFHEGNTIVDVDADSISEAKREYYKLRGHLPERDQVITVGVQS